jgi:hypothetical protein
MVPVFVQRIQMKKNVRIPNIPMTETGRLLVSVFTVFLLLTVPSPAQENDKEILNRLYREIIGSAPAGIVVTMDSVRHSSLSPAADSPGFVLPAGTLTDPTNEQLKNEIEKLVRDAGTRRDGAVKFMQDSR